MSLTELGYSGNCSRVDNHGSFANPAKCYKLGMLHSHGLWTLTVGVLLKICSKLWSNLKCKTGRLVTVSEQLQFVNALGVTWTSRTFIFFWCLKYFYYQFYFTRFYSQRFHEIFLWKYRNVSKAVLILAILTTMSFFSGDCDNRQDTWSCHCSCTGHVINNAIFSNWLFRNYTRPELKTLYVKSVVVTGTHLIKQ